MAPTRDEVKSLASEVLRRVTETSVRVASLNLDAAAPMQSALSVEVNLNLGVVLLPDAILCISRYLVTAEPKDGRVEAEGHWDVEIEIHGQWLLDSSKDLTPEHAKAFTLAVGALTLHPYARTHIQSAVVAAGYPPYTLNMIHSLLQREEDIDLDIVELADETSDQ